MAFRLFAATVGLAFIFYVHILIQLGRERTRLRHRQLIRPAAIVPIRKVATGRQRRNRGRWNTRELSGPAAALLLTLMFSPTSRAQENSGRPETQQEGERILLERIDKLEKRIAELEARTAALASAKVGGSPETTATVVTDGAPADSVPAPSATTAESAVTTPAEPQANGSSSPQRNVSGFLRGTTLNMTLDGYYEYNFNAPVGRVNLLRAYDVRSNSFSLNQAAIVIENAPDVANGKRYGVRLDLQYGQATETLQGNAANEPRPQVYRPVFQAYGTYVAPIGSGLTIDFGKWASAMGIENNYTKDQMNYSRSYFFDFLPFYHMGVRSTYNINNKLTLSYWLVNGVQQTEDFNGFKSQVVQIILHPRKSVTWEMIYHTGKEQPDLVPDLNPTFPTGPTQPGLSTTPINRAPNGRLHIVDSYATWNATSKLTLAGEADYVINRMFSNSAPKHVSGGAAYGRYQWTPKFAIATRAEYLSDRGGLFSGKTQALKETTFTAEYKFADGFLMREEWRRDFSNQPFFLSATPGVLKKEQNTATIGLVWWFGQKQGAW